MTKMEKTLREELEDAFDIARTEGMLHSKDGKHSLSSEADAEGIIEFISQRIKAKALTDEQIADAVLRADDDYNKNHLSQKNDGFNFHQVQNNRRKFIAVAQLQAVLKELDIKENK